MPFYTFIMDYAGGTYISQVEATSPKAAIMKWSRQLDTSQVKGLGAAGKRTLIQQMKDETPVALAGLSNAWCTGARVRGAYALVNLVKTESIRKSHS